METLGIAVECKEGVGKKLGIKGKMSVDSSGNARILWAVSERKAGVYQVGVAVEQVI
jgi:hypothetical protein